MTIRASGPPFVNRELCECGWMWQDECKKLEKCGLNQGMPEYNQEPAIKSELIEPIRPEWKHTPYEFLPDRGTDWEWGPGSIIDLNKVCREVVEDLVKDNKSTHQVGGTHYSEMAVQPWDFYKSIFSPAGYCDYHVGSVISYLSRHRKKGGLQDLEKALHHMQELVRYFKEEEEYE